MFSFNSNLLTFAAESDTVVDEVKIYSQVTIDDDFDDSSVIVIMDKRTDGVNKIQCFQNINLEAAISFEDNIIK